MPPGASPKETFERPSTVWTPGQLGLDPPDGFDRLDAVPAALLHAGRQRQSEGVEEEVLRLEAVAPDGEVVDRPGGAQLPVGGAGLALGVDAGADDSGAVVAWPG